MGSSITVRGFVATAPKFVIVNGLSISSFRLGVSDRRFNRAAGSWENGPTSWYSVSCFRELATNVFASVNKGDPVILTGRLKVSEWTAGDKSGVDVEIEADAVGHDFRWGRSAGFAKNNGKVAAGKTADEAHEHPQPEDQHDDEPVGSWNSPGLELASARVMDAGDPSPRGLFESDDASGDITDPVGAGVAPF